MKKVNKWVTSARNWPQLAQTRHKSVATFDFGQLEVLAWAVAVVAWAAEATVGPCLMEAPLVMGWVGEARKE